MKCPKCYSPKSRVKETRLRDSGIIVRRRRCVDCDVLYTTWELPPGAVSHINHQIVAKWEPRQTGAYKTFLRQRENLTKRMLELKAQGLTAAQIADRVKLSVHMVYYYTSPRRRKT